MLLEVFEGRHFTSAPEEYSAPPLPDDRKALNDLIKLIPIDSAFSIVRRKHTLKYSIGYARTSPYCNDQVPTPAYASRGERHPNRATLAFLRE